MKIIRFMEIYKDALDSSLKLATHQFQEAISALANCTEDTSENDIRIMIQAMVNAESWYHGVCYLMAEFNINGVDPSDFTNFITISDDEGS